MIRISQSAQLPFEKHIFSLGYPLPEQLGRIAVKGLDNLSRIHQITDQLFSLNGWFTVKVL